MRQQQVRRRRTRGGEASTAEEPPPARLAPVGATAARVLESIDEALAGR